MGDNLVEKLAAQFKSDPEPESYVALARIVRTLEGAKRFQRPLGAPISARARELKKIADAVEIDPKTGRVKNPTVPKFNPKLFQMRVEELREAIKKLDRNAIKNLLAQLDATKNLPKSTNYQKIRDMLKQILEEKAGKDDEVKQRSRGKQTK